MESAEGERVIDLGFARVWLARDGVLREVVREGSAFDVARAREVLRAVGELLGGERAPIVVALPDRVDADLATHRFWGSAEVARTISAQGLVVSSPVMRVATRFFLRISKPAYPTELFDEPPAAIAWARQHVRGGSAPASGGLQP